jgi:uncharacterized protein YjbI with pentapeptide repeats
MKTYKMRSGQHGIKVKGNFANRVRQGTGSARRRLRATRTNTGDSNGPGIMRLAFSQQATEIQTSHNSSSDSANLILKAIIGIEGEDIRGGVQGPKSIWEVIHTPIKFKDQPVANLLTQAAQRMHEKIKLELKSRPLSANGEIEYEKRIQSWHIHAKPEIIKLCASIGEKLFEEQGHYRYLEKVQDDKPRLLLFEAISLIEVGRIQWSGLDKMGMEISEERRVEALAQMEILSEMILERAARWSDLLQREEAWRNLSIDEMKWEYKQGRRNFRRISLLEASFAQRDLSGTDLSGADFSNANLNTVNFRGAKLQDTNFTEADISASQFAEANLRRANFRDADLQDTWLEDADLRDAKNLIMATLHDTVINYHSLLKLNTGLWSGQEDLAERINHWTDSRGIVYFDGADLRGRDIQGANLEKAYFRRTNLHGVNLEEVIINEAWIDYQTLLTLNTGEWAGEKTLVERMRVWFNRGGKIDFKDEDLSGQDLCGADLYKAWLINTNLRGADLRGATLTDAELDGVNLDGAKIKVAIIDSGALMTLDTGEWKGKTQEEKIALWRARGGILVDDIKLTDI